MKRNNDSKMPQSSRRLLSPQFICSKLREKGIGWVLKTLAGKALVRSRSVREYASRKWRSAAACVTPNLTFIRNAFRCVFVSPHGKVILGVWDLKAVPWSVGDMMVFIETLYVRKLEERADRVDVCVICDREKPAGNRRYTNIDGSNFRYHLFHFLPIINTLPCLGAVFQFESHAEFYIFLKQRIVDYIVYPSVRRLLDESYNFYGGTDLKEIRMFYNENGTIPYLVVDDYNVGWAYNLYRERAKGFIPVTVSLRGRPDGAGANAEQRVWLRFFELCVTEFPEIMFIVVGIREEVFVGLRDQLNVIVAKDCGSTLSDDFALIRTSLMYLGMNGGMGTISIFSDLPYIIFGMPNDVAEHVGVKDGIGFEFGNSYQKVFCDQHKLTEQVLFKEFRDCYNHMDIELWRNTANTHIRMPYSMPSWTYLADGQPVESR